MKLVGKHKPQGDGALIFDEVKVACQLIWNSRSQTLSGLAMTSKDLSSLNDVYCILEQPDSPKQTSYILQFLWQDLTSNYDIVGPYFTCSELLDGKFIYVCIFETLRLFQAHGLKTSLLVCNVLLILQQLKPAMDFLEPIWYYLQTAQGISMQLSLGLLTRLTHQTSSIG